MIRQVDSHPPIVMEIVTDPAEIARARAQREQFEQNWAWMQTLGADFWDQHRGKCVFFAGQEAFVADQTRDAIEQALAAHPDDKGYFGLYVPREKAARIYAYSR